jgi:hypothetical protein
MKEMAILAASSLVQEYQVSEVITPSVRIRDDLPGSASSLLMCDTNSQPVIE